MGLRRRRKLFVGVNLSKERGKERSSGLSTVLASTSHSGDFIRLT